MTAQKRVPERYHVFVSYTTREDEVQEVKPVVDHFLNMILRPLIEASIGGPPAFYDGYSMWEPIARRRSDEEIAAILRGAIYDSEILMAFLSPEYPKSKWCRFEVRTMGEKPGGVTFPVLWKGDWFEHRELGLEQIKGEDWRPCFEQMTWRKPKLRFVPECQNRLLRTAEEVVAILRRRRGL
jgi:hypothetical protein